MEVDKYWSRLKKSVAEASSYSLTDILEMDVFDFFTLLTILEEQND
jgi:hypothetical protein